MYKKISRLVSLVIFLIVVVSVYFAIGFMTFYSVNYIFYCDSKFSINSESLPVGKVIPPVMRGRFFPKGLYENASQAAADTSLATTFKEFYKTSYNSKDGIRIYYVAVIFWPIVLAFFLFTLAITWIGQVLIWFLWLLWWLTLGGGFVRWLGIPV